MSTRLTVARSAANVPLPAGHLASHVVAGVGEYVAAYSDTAGSSRWHGRPVVPNHQRDTEGPGSAPQPGRVVDAELPPEYLSCGRIKDLPGDDEVDGWVADRQRTEVQDCRQPPFPHQQILRC